MTHENLLSVNQPNILKSWLMNINKKYILCVCHNIMICNGGYSLRKLKYLKNHIDKE